MEWGDVKFFQPVEFESPDEKGSGSRMNLEFVAKLDKLREAVKQPLTILSGYRTPAHNTAVGGVDSSAHELGQAADIAALSSTLRFTIVEAALRLGFTRIGIGSSFVHLDASLVHPQQVCWLYPPSEKRNLTA